jgi:Zn-dependent alcohol dehydrogenase
MITGRFPLERINGALEDLRNGIGARSVIVFD